MYDFKNIYDYSFSLTSGVLSFWNVLNDSLLVIEGKKARLVLQKVITYQDSE